MRIMRLQDAKVLLGNKSRSFQLVGPDSVGARKFMITLVDVRPGGTTPLHEHRTVESMYFVIEGRAEVLTQRERKVVGPNTAVYFPSGGSHGIRNVGRGRLRYLSCHAPPYEIEELYRTWRREARLVVTGG
jgi:mannose-6-phosphate isomerase-like protein (cupin superfamily)